jgi:hypothetical protein
VTITGSGFSPNPGQNDVVVSGSSGGITAESAVSITFTLPFLFAIGIIRDVHVLCRVFNYDNGESALFWIRIKANVDEVALYATQIESAIPGPFEQTGEEEAPRFFEARDFQRLAAALEVFTKEPAPGQVLSFDGTGLALPGGTPGSGSVLEADPADPSGLKWALQQDWMLPFGGQVAGANVLLAAGGTPITPTAGQAKHIAPTDGIIDTLSFLYRGAGTLDRIRILVDGLVAFDSLGGLGIPSLGVYNGAPALAVSSGEEIEIDASRTGAGTDNLVGYARLLLA